MPRSKIIKTWDSTQLARISTPTEISRILDFTAAQQDLNVQMMVTELEGTFGSNPLSVSSFTSSTASSLTHSAGTIGDFWNATIGDRSLHGRAVYEIGRMHGKVRDL